MEIHVVMSMDPDGIGPIHGAFEDRQKADQALRRLSQSPVVNGTNLQMVALELNVAYVPTVGEPWMEKVPI